MAVEIRANYFDSILLFNEKDLSNEKNNYYRSKWLHWCSFDRKVA